MVIKIDRYKNKDLEPVVLSSDKLRNNLSDR